MNKDRAIQMLERMQNPEPYDPQITSEAFDALQMAIDALSADGDTISRQAAITTAVRTAVDWHKLANPQYSIAYCIGEAMRQLPSAGPQERKGKWQITDAYPHNVYCSKCHKRFAQTHWEVWEDGSLPRKFCPNCGCKMEGTDGR